jgi:hypothetical protein
VKNRTGRGWSAVDELEAGTTEDGEPLEETVTVSSKEFDAWRSDGEELVKSTAAGQFAIGDWIVTGEAMKDAAALTQDQNFKNSVYKAAAEITGHSILTVKSIAGVASNISKQLRSEFHLSFAHFKLVASPNLSEETKRDLLTNMQMGARNVADSREMVRQKLGIKDKTKRQRKHERIIGYCDGIMAELDGYDSPPSAVLQKLADTRDVIEENLAELEVEALV